MPIYEYESGDAARTCDHCRNGFTCMQKMSAPRLTHCPQCGAPVTRKISAPAIGSSKSHFDQRAKQAGFHKLQRLGQGEYEKKY